MNYDLPAFRVTNIFTSVDGEHSNHGMLRWTTFIRFAGCSAGCGYCDTKRTWNFLSGREMSLDDLLKIAMPMINKTGANVTITGGEPLEQPRASLLALIEYLALIGCRITIETNGLQMEALREIKQRLWRLQGTHEQIAFSVDYKDPLSLSTADNMAKYQELRHFLQPQDFIKFIIDTEEDYVASKLTALAYKKAMGMGTILFSPVHYATQVPTHDSMKDYVRRTRLLYEMVKHDGLQDIITINTQLHKIIGIDGIEENPPKEV